MISLARNQHHKGGAEKGEGNGHAVPHCGGPCGADEDAVELIAPDRDQRQENDPRQVYAGRFTDLPDARQQVDKQGTHGQIGEHESDGKNQRPEAGGLDRLAEVAPVPRADGLSGQRLGGVGEAIERIGREHLEVQQHRVGGQDHVAHAGAEGGYGDESRLQAQRPYQNVAVDPQHAGKPAAVNRPPQMPMAADAAQVSAHQPEPQADGADLGNQGRPCDAFDSPSQTDDKPKVENDIDAVHEDLGRQGGAGVLNAEEPTQHGEVQERHRRPPDADGKINVGQGPDLGAGVDDFERRPKDRNLNGNQYGADGERQNPCPRQPGAHLVRIPGAQGLCRQTGGAHAQEVAAMIDDAEDEGADGDGAQKMRPRQMTDDGGIDNAQKRHRDIGNDHRPGETPGLAVPVFRRHGFKVPA